MSSAVPERFGMIFAKYWLGPRKSFRVLVLIEGSSVFMASVWGSSFARCPYGDVSGARALRSVHMVTFFFADFVTCANFSNWCGKFFKT